MDPGLPHIVHMFVESRLSLLVMFCCYTWNQGSIRKLAEAYQAKKEILFVSCNGQKKIG